MTVVVVDVDDIQNPIRVLPVVAFLIILRGIGEVYLLFADHGVERYILLVICFAVFAVDDTSKKNYLTIDFLNDSQLKYLSSTLVSRI